jgi:activator of HSP90 ATPase
MIMPKTIQQSVTLPASAAELYRMYLSPRRHAAITGGPVEISAKRGSSFRAFNGALSGKMLLTRSGRMIIQTWRSTGFGPDDLDSTLILTFWPRGTSGRIQLVHANVADRDARAVTEGWRQYYWKPWRAYLRKRRVRGADRPRRKTP